MSQKSRADLATSLTTLINDNTNKEISAADVRAMLTDHSDSMFNLTDDTLQLKSYDGLISLQTQLSNMITTLTPLWGSSDWFDVDNGTTFTSYGTNGIVSSNTRASDGGNGTIVTLNLSQSITGRKIVPVVHYSSNGNAYDQNDWRSLSVREVSDTQILILLDTINSTTQEIRIEIFAFSI